MEQRVIVIGAGFAGLRAVRELGGKGSTVTLIDRQNYHLFQPLLYQVATAGLESESIAHPVRAVVRGLKETSFWMGEVTCVDLVGRTIGLSTGDTLPYDYLVIAAGAATTFFGLESIERAALELKDLDDATRLRNRILTAFEQAAHEPDPEVRRTLLTFIVAGGGPTGIEFAGALAELIRHALLRDYPEIRRDEVRVLLVEAGERLLQAMPAALGAYAKHRLETIGVEVRLNTAIESAGDGCARLRDGTEVRTCMLLWAAGVRAAPLAEAIDTPKGRAGRLIVEPDLSLPGFPEVFVTGDMAYLEQDGQPLPMVAPVAMQQGTYVGKAIMGRVAGRPVPPFHYHDKGSMAVIGRGAAVAQAFGISFRGLPAWLVWMALHLFYLIDFKNRLVVMLNWAYDYFLFDRKVRLIMRQTESSKPVVSPPQAGSQR